LTQLHSATSKRSRGTLGFIQKFPTPPHTMVGCFFLCGGVPQQSEAVGGNSPFDPAFGGGTSVLPADLISPWATKGIVIFPSACTRRAYLRLEGTNLTPFVLSCKQDNKGFVPKNSRSIFPMAYHTYTAPQGRAAIRYERITASLSKKTFTSFRVKGETLSGT